MKITWKIVLFTAVAVFILPLFVFAAEHTDESVSADAALANLKEGNIRFATHEVSQGKPNAAKRAETAETQRPFAIVVGCADSRTSPELIFDHNIGDLFVVRTAGNLVDDYGLGSIEYAVNHLGARLIVVVGHDGCGAVKAALSSDSAPGHVESLVRAIQPAVAAVKGKEGDPLHLAITENARLMADKIRSQADFGQLAKEVQIVFGVYNLATGKVEWVKE